MSTVLRVTAVDVETGDEETVDLPAGEYLLLTTAPCRQAHVQAYGNGTHVITIKGHRAGVPS
jgi:hypothetical protein